MGFGANVQRRQDLPKGEALLDLIPDDLVKFGLIPELVGRLPVLTSLEDLSVDQLVRVLCEPRNSLLKQYEAIFMLDEVELVFEEEALRAVAEEAVKRKTGARGLRNVMEDLLMQLMYEVPSDETIRRVIITPAAVRKEGEAVILRDGDPALTA